MKRLEITYIKNLITNLFIKFLGLRIQSLLIVQWLLCYASLIIASGIFAMDDLVCQNGCNLFTRSLISEVKMSEIQKKWYVLRAISGKENKVKEVS